MAPDRDVGPGRDEDARDGPRCEGSKADGSPCGAPPEFVDPETGLCPSHDPANREKLVEAGKRGAEATKRRFAGGGLDPDDLPALDGPRDAEAWLAALAEGVVAGRVSKSLASEARKILKAWLDAHERGAVSDRLDELTTALDRWRETGDPAPVFEVIDGGRP